jgi:4-hydroxy-tetrahydrodipicolinate reductase
MISLVVGGATGKLGKLVCDLAVSSDDIRLIGAIVSTDGGNAGRELYPGIKASTPDELPSLLERADVYVDLTTPSAASRIIAGVPEHGTNLIVGTTAVEKSAMDAMAANTAKFGTSSLVSANFAIGVNVFWDHCESLARELPDYDIEVIEAHHDRKEDAPSGTAMEAVRRMQEATGIEKVVCGREGITGPRGREIGVHSIRAGDIVGDHTVIFAANGEMIEITHRAISREAFARGCIASIRWIAGKKDGKVHTMNEVLGL